MTAPSIQVLVADSRHEDVEELRALLETNGYGVDVTIPADVLSAIESREFDLVLLDMDHDGRDVAELDVLSTVRVVDSLLPVVVMAEGGSINLAVEAMRRGARDFIQKPLDGQRFLATVRTQAELGQARRREQLLEMENRELRTVRYPYLVAASPAMRSLVELVARLGQSDANVLITGERGVEKGMVARAIHSVSRRSSKTLVSVDVGSFVDPMLASELYGHVRGAFPDSGDDRVGRFELADGGSLFLDEIANIPLPQQGKLLRVLETGELARVGSARTRRVNVRVISGTSARLDEEVAAGHFRADLFTALSPSKIAVPPLRERPEDIPLLAMEFLRRYAALYRKPTSSFDEKAAEALLEYSWPGNLQELHGVIQRAVLTAATPQLTANDLALGSLSEKSVRLEELSLEEVEYMLVKKTMKRFDGNVAKAAEALGLTRSSMYRRLRRFGL